MTSSDPALSRAEPTRGRRAKRKPVGLDRNLSVFINVPYDTDYEPIFDGIVFATVCCGYIPRCAIESGQTAEPRIRMIIRALKGSKFSIHDLCRCQGHGDQNLARFNMPLELGIAMAERFDETKPENWHDWLVLVPDGHVYGAFISDLAGYDPKRTEERVERVIPVVMSWLSTRENAVESPSPSDVLKLLPQFLQARRRLREEWCGHEPWGKIVEQAVSIGKDGRLIPA